LGRAWKEGSCYDYIGATDRRHIILKSSVLFGFMREKGLRIASLGKEKKIEKLLHK
jgi:hypothetical protein